MQCASTDANRPPCRPTRCHPELWTTRLDPVSDALPALIAVIDEDGWICASNLA